MDKSANTIAPSDGKFVLRCKGRPDQARAVALVVHGLNMKPVCMTELEDVFLDLGYLVLRGILEGHGEHPSADLWPEVTSENWLQDMAVCRREAVRIAAGRPIVLCGFSLGAAAGLAEILASAKVEGAQPQPPCCGAAGDSLDLPAYAACVFFSPAIRLRPWAHLVRLFFFWPRLGLRSLAGKHYRVHTKTTVAAYRALFGLRVIIRDGLAKRKNTVGQHDLPPILVFYDRKDILTASAALGRWLSSQGDKTLYAVSARNRWHHLIIDHRALGAPGWAAMQSQLKKWLILHKL